MNTFRKNLEDIVSDFRGGLDEGDITEADFETMVSMLEEMLREERKKDKRIIRDSYTLAKIKTGGKEYARLNYVSKDVYDEMGWGPGDEVMIFADVGRQQLIIRKR